MIAFQIDGTRIISCVVLYILSLQFLHSNSRFSTHWKLDEQQRKIVKEEDAIPNEQNLASESTDYVFQILNSAIYYQDYWVVEETNVTKHKPATSGTRRSKQENNFSTGPDFSQPLSCGPVVNFTTYDHLKAMALRHSDINIEEPESLLRLTDDPSMVNILSQLKLDLKRKPNEAATYNAIGSYWRATGQSQKAINCLRKALTLNQDNPDALLYLARIFYNLNFLDDALFLAQRSLDVQLTTENSAWFHYFSIGEILKAKGEFQRANMNFRISVKLNPDFEPALAHLQQLELLTNGNFYIYSIILIIFLISVSIHLIINMYKDSDSEEEYENCKVYYNKSQRRRIRNSLHWQTNTAINMNKNKSFKKCDYCNCCKQD